MPAAKNELGQLFVDLDVTGAGKVLKTLNSVSASFLLTKNAAAQVLTPLVNIGKEAMNSAVGVGKLGASFGTTLMEAQKLTYYLKQFNLSSGLLNNLSSIQDKITRARQGYGGLDGSFQQSMNFLGLDWLNYDGSAESMMQLVRDAQTAIATRGLDVQTAKMHMQNIGLSDSDWLYAFQRSDFNLENALSVSDETIQNLIEVNEELNKTGNEIDKLKKNATSGIAKNGGMFAIQDLNKSFDGDKGAINRTIQRGAGFGIGMGATGAVLTLTGVGASVGIPLMLLGGAGGLAGTSYLLNKQNNATGPVPTQPLKFNENLLNYNPLPSPTGVGGGDKTAYIEIRNENNIYGNNAEEIADKIAKINSQDIQMTQYQVHNMAAV